MLRMHDPKFTRVHPEVFSSDSPDEILAQSLGPLTKGSIVERHAAYGGGTPVETDAVSDDAASELSNPDRWNNNFAKKMLDMQFHFSCGPLRVAKCCPEHWDRLHATHKTLMPLPGGRLELFKERIPHTSDEELQKLVQSSGVAKLRVTAADLRAKKRTTTLPARRVDTPLLNHLLRNLYVAPLPQNISENDPKRLLQRRLDQANGVDVTTIAPKDCDSVFSRTTAATKISDAQRSAALSSGVSVVAKEKKLEGNGVTSVVNGSCGASHHSSKASNGSRVSKLRDAIADERSLTAMAMNHIRAASEQLDKIEKALEGRQQPVTATA